ncbi:outer membrane protein assembly factor BamB family protein [Streptomyces lancefieldiae]|uniref:PQQ-binding-like beta-propeller repeat protein n=1 Tax=Streptomyces lancefieldiae TaxID=3075520 RepID=A0ABU3AJB9_9ACTN|nr:PQQ-binding-like beta-propeller repeat protein [Streptomyces sp. DSM 40712]MDT0610005.1 PQQ-binding-like beta-propeller repeat protein [Streptomyces sp. DSM 40712]
MSQPPNQPPQPGGFGAPQDPPPGGFGAPAPQPPQGPPSGPPPQPQPGYGYPPQQQPPQPGYGYPQQPPGQPAQPGPYTQPGPYNSGPYGQPQQPGPYGRQPGYGYPQPQFPGTPGTPPPGGSGSRNPFKGKPALAVGAAVAALLVIGGGVWAVTANSGDDKDKKPVAGKSDDPKPTGSGSAPVDTGDGSGDGGEDPENLNEGRQAGESQVLWYKEAPDAPGSGADAPGMWITGKTAVKAAYKQVVAYDVGDGKPSWDPIVFPEKICSVTPEKTADDKIVVVYMSGSSDRAKCNQMQEIDLATGAKGWKAEIEDGELFDSTLSVELNVSGQILMAGRSQSGTAYDVTTGKKLYDKKRYGDACFPAGFATGPTQIVQVASCGAGGNNDHDELQGLDPKTGKVLWTYPYEKGWRVERAYSVDPLVVYATNEEKKVWNISTFTSAGKVLQQVGVQEDFAPECGWAILERDLQGCEGVVVADNTLYLPTEATSGANAIVAIDLTTGKEKWRVKSPAEESMMPMKAEGGQLIAYVRPSYDAGGQVVSIATGGGDHQPAKLMQNPRGVAEIENSFYSKDIDWVDGRFYISSTRLSGDDDSKEKLMLAYGK